MTSYRRSPGIGLFFIALCFIVNLHGIQGVKVLQKEKEVLDNLLKNYDPAIRPTGVNSTTDDAATVVTVNLYILALNKLDDKSMDLSFTMYFRQSWNDERFRFSSMGGTLKYLTLHDSSKIWTPDVFFTNEKKGFVHEMVKPNYFLRIYPNGNVLYSNRITLTTSCPMNLAAFPFDRQICDLFIESYGSSYDDLQFKWQKEAPVGHWAASLPEFGLIDISTSTRVVYLTTGNYSILEMHLELHRSNGFYILQLFIPSAMLVLLSWTPFWLDRGALTARVVLAVATLITLATQASTFCAGLVRISYVRSSDVWLGVCVTFTFAALMETVVVHYWHRGEERKRGNTAAAASDEEAVEAAAKTAPRAQEGNGTSKLRLKERACDLKTRLANVSTNSKRLDIISRVAFPIGFALFVILYCLA